MPKIVDENVKPAGIPSFMSYSKISTPDLSAAKGIQGLADIFGIGVDALDKLQAISAKRETEQTLTGLQEGLIKELEQNLGGAANAMKQGKMSEVEYWLKAHTIVKDAKRKYPGYTEVIDSVTSRVMGVKPANVLQREYFKQLETSEEAGAEIQKETFKLLKQAANKGVLDNETIANILRETDPTKQMQYQGLLLSLINQRGKIDYMKTKMELKAKLGELSKEEVQTTAKELVSQHMSSFFTQSVLNAKTNYFDLLEQVGADAKVTPEEHQKLVTTVNALKSQFRSSLMQLMFTPGENGKSMAQVLGTEEVKKIVEDSVKTFDEFIVKPVAQSGGDLSLLKANAKMWENLMLNNKMEAVALPTMRKIATLREIAGQEAVKFVFTRNPDMYKKFMDEANKFLTASEISDALGLDGDTVKEPKALSEVLKAVNEKIDGPDKTVASNVLIDTLYKTLTGKGVDPRAKRNAFIVFFNNKDENILSRIDPKDREAFFKRMISTSVRKAVAELENEIPGAKEQYARWVLGNAGVLYRDKIGMLQEWQQSGEITVDEKGRIDWSYKGTDQPTKGNFTVDRFIPTVQQTIDEITKPLRLLGVNPQKATQMLLEINNVATVPVNTKPEFDIQRQNAAQTPRPRPEEQIQQQAQKREELKQALDEYLKNNPRREGYYPEFPPKNPPRLKRKSELIELGPPDPNAPIPREKPTEDIQRIIAQKNEPKIFERAHKFASEFKGDSVYTQVGNKYYQFRFRKNGRIAVGDVDGIQLVIAGLQGEKLSPQWKTKYYVATLPVAMRKSPLKDALQAAKTLGKPNLVVTSLVRDDTVNKDAGGVKRSQHRHGKAIDIPSWYFKNTKEKMRFIEEMFKRGYRRFGFYRSGTLHIDSAGKGGKPVTWGSTKKSGSTPKFWKNFLNRLYKKYGK